LTESPKTPPRPVPHPVSGAGASKAPVVAPSSQGQPPSGASPSTAPPPPPTRSPTKPAPLPAALTREPARDTLAPSSFGVLGSANKSPSAPKSSPMRAARAPLPTLGDLEGATATATLRPPGAVPPPPRALPMTTPAPDVSSSDRSVDKPFTALSGDLPPSSRTPRPRVTAARSQPLARENATLLSPSLAATKQGKPAGEAALESTLDTSGSVSKKATHTAPIEQTRLSESGPPAALPTGTAVPAPGLFIADEPVERRPQQLSLVSAQRQSLTRIRVVALVLGGLLLMAAGALVVMFVRRADANAARATAPAAKATPRPPGCALLAPPSRISTIERTVPISALPRADGTIALAIADTKTTAAGWLYDPLVGEPTRKLEAPAGSGDVSHVSATEPLLVDHASADFAFAQTLSPGLAIGVGPSGLLRRGDDGATGVVWPMAAGSKVTPPRVGSTPAGHLVAFRQGGANGQLLTLWLDRNGAATGPAAAVEGAPKTLGTPNVALLGERSVVLFSARGDKAEPYRVYASLVESGQQPGPARPLELPADGGGAIAPSLAPLPGDRYLVQWTDGNVGQYQVHVRILDRTLQPLGDALLVSGKGANAGQGTIVTTARAAVSFFIQTTAGHDELWGATLSCH
jgi:hypothetical protein